MSKEKFAVIVDAVRSPIGIKNGKMIGMRPDDLSAQVVKALLERNKNLPVEKIEDVVLGCAFPEGTQGMLMARGVAVLAGIPKEAGAKVVNRFCGSSMDAVHQINQAILSGDMECGLAVGTEDMFSVPMGGYNPSFHPELMAKNFYIGMGETAENLARELNIPREEQEEFAMNSHKKALKAYEEGKFANEVVAVSNNGTVIDRDEGPREPDPEKIKSLQPAFLKDGTITAATSSPISIGSAAVLVTSNTLAEELGLKPRARIISRAVAGVEWELMGKGPIPASQKALERAGMTIDDIDYIELNEAFAAQSLYVLKKTGWDMKKVNVNGGAVALGHPLGCSGARILTTLLNVLEQNKGKYGLATMCIGSGQGIATVIERM
ncbi:MAG TPA: thiolase family protein [Caldithrix abyssi]|uniref:acetyl-CoA C-acyltransferase n=1 Tax=Caldithrix abyssi TaxID=187145 RepID=A0A7V4WVY8_CALAY|nr:thiolase family protein [Caldithrix abyssi]